MFLHVEGAQIQNFSKSPYNSELSDCVKRVYRVGGSQYCTSSLIFIRRGAVRGGKVRTILRAHDGRGPPEGET